MEVRIPSKHHQSLIGSKGRLIRAIMDECGGVHIHFPNEGSGSDRVTIRGPKDEVERAKKQLVDLTNEKVSTNNFMSPGNRAVRPVYAGLNASTCPIARGKSNQCMNS